MALRSFSHYDAPGGNECDCRRVNLGKDGETMAFVGFSALALVLLLICALLAGLTLAICSLDITFLQVLGMTGDQRQRNQVFVISRIKRHASWFLCSMIICSTACAESFPILIESLFGTDWLPIVISTIAIALFAELLPQYLIPRNAIFWGYYCWPLIWGCMWLTCIISWPLSYLLDKISGPQADRAIYTNEQLGILIKFHERTEKHGGLLGPDAGRVMRGALDLDRRTLGGECQASSRKGKSPLVDVERGEAVKSDIIVPWSLVRRISVNEEVTKEFILRIKSWAYSRIPVLGDPEAGCNGSTDTRGDWNDQKVYGFLHVKNLVGLELPDQDSQSKKLFVKDLPLYPLPIIRDDLPLYDLLNVFQLGMARMAVVIPRPTKDRLAPLSASAKNEDALPRHQAPLWSAFGGLNTRNTIEIGALDAQIDWTVDFLGTTQNDVKLPQHRKQSVIGIGCPKPIGIVTYEDILDALLQKTSLDEKDFFNRVHVMPPTKGRKEGDVNSVSSNHSVVTTTKAIPDYVQKVHAAFEKSGDQSGVLRRRNITEPIDGIDGVSEPVGQGFDGANDGDATLRTNEINDRSSYTENSLGGFHCQSSTVGIVADLDLPSEKEIVEFKIPPTSSASAPPINLLVDDVDSWCIEGLNPIPSSSSSGSPTVLSGLRRVTPFATQPSLIYERTRAVEHYGPTISIISSLGSVQGNGSFGTAGYENILVLDPSGTLDRHHGGVVGAMSACSLVESQAFAINSDVDSPNLGLPVTSNNLNIAEGSSRKISSYTSKIVSRNEMPEDDIVLSTRPNGEIRLREESFHDDRTLLPSQRRKKE